MTEQHALWPADFADRFLSRKQKWVQWGPGEALEDKNIVEALAITKGTAAADVIAALVLEVDRQMATIGAMLETINRLREMKCPATPGEIEDETPNVEFSGAEPLSGGASAGTQGSASGR